MTALWVHEAAERFWADAGGPPPDYPCDLREPISWALPLDVIELPGLSVARIDEWLAARGNTLRLGAPDRPLHGCVLARNDVGILFVDAADHPDERRFSLAHEVAHYLVEYHLPRERTRTRLGDAIAGVLDGRRPASRGERIDALLSGVSLATCLHLMERTPDGHPPGVVVSSAERRADALAFELLAPLDAVWARVGERAERPVVEAALRAEFGLPPAPARAYARQLAPEPPSSSLARRLFGVS